MTEPGARSRERFPAAVYRHGTEPDPRFSLANERTFLAWVRTSLALLAVAAALLTLDLPLTAPFQWVGATLFALASALASAWAWVTWARSERALRLGRPLGGLGPAAAIAPLVVLGVVTLACGLVVDKAGW